MIKRLFISILAPVLICSFIQPVYADTLYGNLSAIKNGSGTLQDQTNAQNLPGDTVLTQAESIQASIDEVKKVIDQDTIALDQHKQTIAKLNVEQQTLADQQKKDTETLGNYVKSQYIEGGNPSLQYVNLLVSSTSIGDLISRSSYVDTILNYYKDLKTKIAANSELIKSKQSLEQTETKKLTDEIQSKQLLSDGLSVALAKQTELENSLAKDAAQSRGLQDGPSSAPVKLNGQVGQLLSFGSTFLGVPYTWGGTYPQFDCSSYVQYVFGHFGINLGRVTWDQYGQGQSVSRDNLQAGDLVFFSTYQAGPSHVGIYVGNGMMINSSNSGVSYASIDSPYWSSRYFGARRVIA
ncbi:MAG TPA: NlpC/P60 family protein [Desulfosporosinus sp.]